jgi:hypothetical protein
VDLDGDGCKDVLSGSYWPGEIWLFRGTKAGAFEKGAALKDAEGKVLHAGPAWKSDEEPQMDSLAAAPFAHDHDGDGDLDLLVGNIQGRVILLRNDGGPAKPVFGKSKEPVEAGGRPIQVPGGDAGPTIGDWDLDGKPDLIVGAGDGSVSWYRNTGTVSRPVYAEGVVLLPAAKQEGDKALAAGSPPQRPGMRTKPCVADYDGDGRLDLLVGDFSVLRRPAPELTAADTERRDALRRRREELQQEYTKLLANKERPAKDDPEFRRLGAAMGDLTRQLAPLEEGSEYHGWVGFYRRGGGPAAARQMRL